MPTVNPNWNSTPVVLTDENGQTWKIEWDEQDGSDKLLVLQHNEDTPRWEHIGDANEVGLNIWHDDSDMCAIPWELVRIAHRRLAERSMWMDDRLDT